MSDELFDLEALAETDEWLDDVATRTVAPGDPLAATLVGWLDGIDRSYRPRPLPMAVVRPRRLARRSVALAAAGALALAGAGTAVAAPFSPVHQAIFGPGAPVRPVPSSVDETGELQSAAGLVASAASVVESGTAHGFVDSAARDRAVSDLLQASGLLSPLPGSPVRASLEERITVLRLELGQLPNQPASTSPAPAATARPTETARPETTPGAGESPPAPEAFHSSPPDGGDAGDSSPAASDG